MLGRLIGTKLRSLRGRFRSDESGYRAPVFLGLSALFWALLFRGSLWVVGRAAGIEPVGDLLVQKLLAITFLVFLALLLFSNLVTVFTTFYLADDLQFLVTKPVGDDALFASRFVESLAQSSWVLVVFGLPIFVAAGVGLEAPASYYAVLAAVMVPFVTLPTAIATLVALLLTNLLEAQRTRDVMLFFGLVAFTALFVAVRAMRPERLVRPDEFESIGEMLELLSAPGSPYLPSRWCMDILEPFLLGSGAVDPWSAGMLVLTPAALFILSAWAHRRWFARGYSKAQEGRHGPGVLGRLRNWFRERTRDFRADLERQIEHLRNRGSRPIGTLRELVRKDLLVFVRDASQWSQLLIVAAVMIVYLVNYKYFEIAAETRLFGNVGLFYFNLAACGFVVVALAGRFLFPAVSLEGRNIWMIRQAPVDLETYLVGKWLGAAAPVVGVGQVLIWLSNTLVVQNWFFCVTASLLVLDLSIGVAAMAVGLGAVYPQFDDPNAAKIASSFGAVIFMILGMFVVLATLVGTFHVIMHWGSWVDGSALYDPTVWHYLAASVGALLPIAAAGVAIRVGANALRHSDT